MNMPEVYTTQSKEVKTVTRRDFLKRLVVLSGSAVLGSCVPEIGTESPISESVVPSVGPTASNVPETPTVEATLGVELIPTVEGVVIGSELSMGGATLVLERRSAEELAVLVEAESRKWRVVSDGSGKVSCFNGEVENQQIMILGQGPAGYEWDADASVWINRETREVVIPDVIVPGSWNAEQELAGPFARASFAFMIMDENQSPRNVVIFSAETMEVLGSPDIGLDGGRVDNLSDGSVMFVGESKKVVLGEGERIVRDPSSLTLIIIDADNKPVRQMITNWSQIGSEEEVVNIGAWVKVEAEAERRAPSVVLEDNDDRNFDFEPRKGMTEEEALAVVGQCWGMMLAVKMEMDYDEFVRQVTSGQLKEVSITYPKYDERANNGWEPEEMKLDPSKPLVVTFEEYVVDDLSRGPLETVGANPGVDLFKFKEVDGQLFVTVFLHPKLSNHPGQPYFGGAMWEIFKYIDEGGVVSERLDKTGIVSKDYISDPIFVLLNGHKFDESGEAVVGSSDPIFRNVPTF